MAVIVRLVDGTTLKHSTWTAFQTDIEGELHLSNYTGQTVTTVANGRWIWVSETPRRPTTEKVKY